MSEPCIIAEDLAFAHGRRAVIDGVSLAILPGEVVALTGENGSGKSTLLALLAGVLRPDRGAVLRRVAHGYCPQSSALYDHLTPDEHFDLYSAARRLPRAEGRSRAGALMERFGLARERRKKVSELSGGTRQKLNLALALLHDPPLVLLDEPYAGFDLETYARFVGWIEEARARGRAVLVVSHLSQERELFDRRHSLRDGRLSCESR